MFTKKQYQSLFSYHWHTTERLLQAASRLEEADLLENPGCGHGSIHDLFFHLLITDQGWRLGLETGRQQVRLDAEAYPDLPALQHGFAEEQVAWQGHLDALSEEEFQGSLPVSNRRGDTYEFERWRVLQHLILHGMQHHAELAERLTAKGQSPGDLDFIFYRPT